jgi:tetratricopeptide (TPR) repeat protein
VTLSPSTKVSAIGARDSDFIEESWMQCSSMVLLHKSALVHFKTNHYNSARALLSSALELLASEIDSKSLVSAKFYEDPQNAALAMSLHFLMANVLLKEGQCSPDHDLISNDNIVEAVVLECSLAIKLAEKYLQVDARNGLLVAQVLSLLGYCMLLMFDDSQDIQDALEFYQTATTLYNGYRGEADMARTPLAEMDKTKNSFRRQADITTGEVTACAA